MIDFQLRASSKMINQIGAIERLAGRWDRVSDSNAAGSDELINRAIVEGAKCSFFLDQTTPQSLLLNLPENVTSTLRLGYHGIAVLKESTEASPVDISPFARYIESFSSTFQLTPIALSRFYRVITGIGTSFTETDPPELDYRTGVTRFLSPIEGLFPEGVVFSTISPFLIAPRVNELLGWAEKELEQRTLHPLIVIGIFHLLFLQIHPFPAANHRLGLLCTWHLLCKHGFGLVAYSHFSPFLAEHTKEYLAALRQAEKTARGNWSTINIWLELFLQSVLNAGEKLLQNFEFRIEKARLTSVQQRILDIVKTHGSVTRERIVKHTGLNLSTVKYNLGILAEKGHLQRYGGGRTTNYRMV